MCKKLYRSLSKWLRYGTIGGANSCVKDCVKERCALTFFLGGGGREVQNGGAIISIGFHSSFVLIMHRRIVLFLEDDTIVFCEDLDLHL